MAGVLPDLIQDNDIWSLQDTFLTGEDARMVVSQAPWADGLGPGRCLKRGR